MGLADIGKFFNYSFFNMFEAKTMKDNRIMWKSNHFVFKIEGPHVSNHVGSYNGEFLWQMYLEGN